MLKKGKSSPAGQKHLAVDNNRYKMFLFWSVVIISFFLYLNTLNNGYNLDDELVTKNHPITSKGFSAIGKIFSQPYYSDASGNAYEYRPIVLLSFAIEHQFFGDNPSLSHLFNVILYTLIIFVLFKLLALLFSSYSYILPFTITLLFAAHPLHTEVVASIKNRDELLAFLFGISCLWFGLKFINTGKKKFIIIMTLFFLLGVLSKKSILPFALVVPIALVMFRHLQLSQVLMISLPLGFIAAITSYFFDINIRILFFVAVPIIALLFYNLKNKSSFKDFFSELKKVFVCVGLKNKNLQNNTACNEVDKNARLFFYAIISVSVLLMVMGVLNNARLLLIFVVLSSSFLYLYCTVKLKEFLLIVISVSVLALYVQNGMILPLLLFFLFFLKNINIRNHIHQICVFLIVLPVFISFQRYGILLFYFLLLASIVWTYRIKKNNRLPFILSFVFFSLFTIASFVLNSFEIETIFLLITFVISGLTYTKWFETKPLYVYFIALIIPALFIGEMLFVEGVMMPIGRVDTIELSKASNILPDSGRFLDFAEMPINNETPLNIRLGTAFMSMAFYLKLMLLPHPLGFYYGYDTIPIVSITNHWALVSLVMHLALLIIAFWVFKKNKIISFSIFYYLICLSIFSNAFAPVAGLIAERLAFVASLGFCITLSYFILKVARININGGKLLFNNIFIITVIVVFGLYALKTFSRNMHWKNHLTLYENDIAYLKRSAQAHNLYANALLEYALSEKNTKKKQAMHNKAVEHFNEALNIYPKFFNAAYALGETLLAEGKFEQSQSAFEKALEIDSLDYVSLKKLGIIHYEKNRDSIAELYFLKSLEIKDNQAEIYPFLTSIYQRTANFSKAIGLNLALLEKEPNNYEAIVNIGKIYLTQRNLEPAVKYFEKAYNLNKNDKNVINALYEINKVLGNKTDADFYLSKLN